MKTVTEIARRFNVSAGTIRHYTKFGLLALLEIKLMAIDVTGAQKKSVYASSSRRKIGF